MVKKRFGAALSNYSLLPGHNISLGLRAEAEDLGLTAEPRSLVAPPKGGPADYGAFGLIFSINLL